jgi:hypothetical protein
LRGGGRKMKKHIDIVTAIGVILLFIPGMFSFFQKADSDEITYSDSRKAYFFYPDPSLELKDDLFKLIGSSMGMVAAEQMLKNGDVQGAAKQVIAVEEFVRINRKHGVNLPEGFREIKERTRNKFLPLAARYTLCRLLLP